MTGDKLNSPGAQWRVVTESAAEKALAAAEQALARAEAIKAQMEFERQMYLGTEKSRRNGNGDRDNNTAKGRP